MTDQDPTTIRRLYGRAKGHKLRERQQALMDDLYPRLALGVPETIPGATPQDRKAGPATLDPMALFGTVSDVWLEIGFGGGEHLAWQAEQHPHVGLIGCEPFLNGMVSLLGKVEGRQNVRVHRGDALDVLERLPPACLGRAFLLHPDPWPKARHAKRRFVNPGPLAALARVMKPGAELRMGTDDPTYMQWALMQMQRQPWFDWIVDTAKDWQARVPDWPPTRYEQKALRQGKTVWYFRYRRRVAI